jgi:signal transduction histidine kinase
MKIETNQKNYQRELNVITEVSKSITAALELPELLQQVIGRITELLTSSEFGVVFVWEESTNVLRPMAASGHGLRNLGEVYKMVLKPGESISGKTFEEGIDILLNSPDEIAAVISNLRPANRTILQQALAPYENMKSVVAVPLVVSNKKYGVLILASLLSTPSPAFSSNDLPIVHTLADLIALAIHRATLESETLATREMQQVGKMRAEALATLSHELRTPLASIKGYSTALLLEEIDWPEEKRREFLMLVDKETDNLQTMITDILDSSLIDIGQLSLEYQPVRLDRLVVEVCDEMGVQTDTHRMAVDFPAGFPIVDADPYRLKQVVRNILDNAIKYSPLGGLIIARGEIRRDDVVITISDQGVGISPEDLIPLFEKYFRVKAPTGVHVPGTGLGLPVAREIVEAHSGRIWAESKVGEGTSISFSIPLKEMNDSRASKTGETKHDLKI